MAASSLASPSSIVVQVQEQRVTLSLPNGERTTASEVLNELSRGPLSDQLQGKRLKLIFSGRVLDPREFITAVVPFGAVVQCAVTSEGRRNRVGRHSSDEEVSVSDDDSDSERVHEATTARTRRTVRERYDYSDFVWGFMLGFVVGPLMCFWLLEPAPRLQKLGICLGCTVRTMTYEYRQMAELTSSSAVEGASIQQPEPAVATDAANSFDVVSGADLM